MAAGVELHAPCTHARLAVEAGPRVRRVAILGNVNVGKSTIFGRLCEQATRDAVIVASPRLVPWGVLAVGPGASRRALRRHCTSCTLNERPTAGGPGPCIETVPSSCPAVARWRWVAPWRRGPAEAAGSVAGEPAVTHLFDAPGAATLLADGEEELVARDLLLSGTMHAAVLVADAKNLRRSLALALEVAEFGLPMVVGLNMMDEAQAMGLDIDDDELTRLLGVPVIRTIAAENLGVRRLAELVLDAQTPSRRARYPAAIEDGLTRLAAIVDNAVVRPRALGLLLLGEDDGARAWVATHLGARALAQARAVVDTVTASSAAPLRVLLAEALHGEAESMVERAVTRHRESPSLLVHFGRLAQRPVSGALIAALVLAASYLWAGVLAAQVVVGVIDAHLIRGFLQPWCERLVAVIPVAYLRDAIVDRDFGLLPTGVFLALGTVLPVLFAFYLLQTLLEDSGYLPRLSVLCDQWLRRLGLNGRGLVPLMLGFSCCTMAVITARLLPTRKERFILTLLVAGVPCAPLSAVMLVLLSSMPWSAAAFVVGLVALRLAAFGFIAGRLSPEGPSDLILEIPRMRLPRPSALLKKSWWRTRRFMREAIPVFMVASLAVFVFSRTGGLAALERFARPVVQGWLGLPEQAVQVFIKTAIRRESGATELCLLQGQFSHLQLVVTMLVMTFVVPCLNASIVIFKERGVKMGAVILAVVVATALAAGAAVHLVCTHLGITFSA